MPMSALPRLTIAGISGDSGKTILSCGLVAALKDRGLNIAAFKKGPDYIDPAWLRLASGSAARNLDTFLMDINTILSSFAKNASGFDLSVIEGNRGLFDGFDEKGSHSTAELAKLLKSPVILVFPGKKVTRTTAAIVKGCKMLDREVDIRGVVVNLVSGERHKNIIKRSIEEETGIPVLGFIPRSKKRELLPSRHLGLIMPGEYEPAKEAVGEVKKLVGENVDLEEIIRISGQAPELDIALFEKKFEKQQIPLKIGYFSDKAFSFYYPENLEALVFRGAELIKISSLEDHSLPDLDALYIGGGFPETNIIELSANKGLMEDIRKKAESGLPVYAECGGLIYLCKSLETGSEIYEMAGIFPLRIVMKKMPQGHGYAIAEVNCRNPFYPVGYQLKGHEFHYSTVADMDKSLTTCLSLKRGTGIAGERDGLVYKNVFAGYIHIHQNGTPVWAESMIKAAKAYAEAHN